VFFKQLAREISHRRFKICVYTWIQLWFLLCECGGNGKQHCENQRYFHNVFHPDSPPSIDTTPRTIPVIAGILQTRNTRGFSPVPKVSAKKIMVRAPEEVRFCM